MRALLASVAILFVVISAFADRSEVLQQEATGRVISVDRDRSIRFAHDAPDHFDPGPISVDITRDTILEREGQSGRVAVSDIKTGQRVQIWFHLPPGSRRREADRVRVLAP